MVCLCWVDEPVETLVDPENLVANQKEDVEEDQKACAGLDDTEDPDCGKAVASDDYPKEMVE